jgi:hypothetical protein
MSMAGFTLTAWRNFPLASTLDTAHLHVADLNLAYEQDWKKLRIEPALDAYINEPPPGIRDPNTMEVSLRCSYPTGPLRFFTHHAFDVVAYQRSYFGEAGAEFELPIRKRAAIEASVRSGWASPEFNNAYIGVRKAAFDFVGADASLQYYPRKHLLLQPQVEFSSIVDPTLRRALAWPTVLSFGLAMGFEH